MQTFPAIRLAIDNDAASPVQATIAKLTELAGRLKAPNTFFEGQIVTWKAGLQNRQAPDYCEPAIVTEVLPAPIFDPSHNTAGSPYFQEPLTLVIGVYRDEDLIEFRVDDRQFVPLAD